MAEMMARVTPHNLHSEFDTGLPMGNGSMVKRPYVPVRGDIVWLTFNPGSGTSLFQCRKYS